MPSKSGGGNKVYILIAAVIAGFILIEWISVFIFGRVPAGYP